MQSDSVLTSSAISRIPQEIWDHIILLASHPGSVLPNFSLVSRAWLSTSRFLSFRHRHVQLSSENTRNLQFLMRSPHATLTRYIRHLVIQWDDPIESPSLDDMRLLPPFPSVQTLEIDDRSRACVRFGSLSSQQTLARIFPTLTSLKLVDCVFATFDDVVTLVSSFPLLNHLDLYGIDWSQTEMTHSARGSYLPPLLNLSIQYGPIEEWLTWILSFDSLPPIRTLRLRSYLWLDMYEWESSLDKFLRGLGSSLEHLHINEYAIQAIKTVDISHNTQLRTIRIEFAVDSNRLSSLIWIHDMIAGIRSTHFEKLVFQNCIYDDGCNLDAVLYLRKLDHLLNRPRFANLQQVEFLDRLATISFADMIFEKMPLCSSRGILLVSQTNEH